MSQGGLLMEDLLGVLPVQIHIEMPRDAAAQVCRRHPHGLWQVVVEEEEEVVVVDSSRRWNGQANSSKRISGTSGAVASGAAQLGGTVSPQKKNTRGGDQRMEKERTAKAKARASTGPASANNNCTSGKDTDMEGCHIGGVAVVRSGNATNASGKRRRSPAVLMEGSRCSRVNGRGWRCCQQTLVGYSLCEHHLGKGRLRSMSSVRGQLGTSKPKWSANGRNGVVPSTSPEEQEEAENDEQRQHPAVAADNGMQKMEEEEDVEEEEEKTETKKRKKIGMVKARSISSLLDNTKHPAPSSSPSQEPHGREASKVS
ncbi:hypothetical protein C4D60_Mb10t02040 [Musa balbisiana]|uniref:WRC domain-containing protein n=1 Tax=Musa balbisiana TaxID=52838 RepID=A0A4S8IVD3_MUSBA|nr:hypothetical protein C4D60_Mb10t02040 [Musa balbisiana]